MNRRLKARALLSGEDFSAAVERRSAMVQLSSTEHAGVRGDEARLVNVCFHEGVCFSGAEEMSLPQTPGLFTAQSVVQWRTEGPNADNHWPPAKGESPVR